MGQVRRSRWAFLSGWRRTARLYLKSKIGMIGLVIIIFFVVLAVFSPQLGPNNPVTGVNLATPLSPPAWATIFPGYQKLVVTSNPVPPTGLYIPAVLGAWKMSGQNYTMVINTNSSQSPATEFPGYTGSVLLNASIVPNVQIANSSTPNAQLPYGQVFFSMSRSFKYTNAPGQAFTFQAQVLLEPLTLVNVSDVYLDFIISGPTGNWSLATVNAPVLQSTIDITPNWIGQGWEQLNVSSGLIYGSDIPVLGNSSNISGTIFNAKGTYTLTMELQGVPCQPGGSPYDGSCVPGTNTSLSMLISTVNFHISGGAFGLLGTDNLGRDVWSEFVWGSQISLLIGILSGVGAVALGTLAGLTAGYLGGMGDEIISRVTDFVLVLPFLPFVIICVFILTQNPALYANIYEWVIVLFIVISWPSIAKIIRSQVLTVKERAYVEASRAVGGGTGHIIRKHILPNVMGLVYSQVALNVAGFILLEAALDYLSISIHSISTMTWGIMLTQALPYAVVASNDAYVWWWFLPPGIAIAALSLAFVLVGFALDSIFNPRLRAR
jgi:peptide/nickel transport system permease protein